MKRYVRFLPSSTQARGLSLTGLLLAVLAGCATVGPDYREPMLPLPGAWSRADTSDGTVSSAGTQNLSRWWQGFGNSVLSNLVEQAFEASPDLRSARAKLRKARVRRDLAGAHRFPTVIASASGSRSHGSTETGIGATRVSLAAEVALNYVGARSAQVRIAIAEASLASQSETLQLTEWRVQAGLASSLELEQARANREQTRAQIPALKTILAGAEHRLALLLAGNRQTRCTMCSPC